jgi:hypothetical protein
LIPGTLSFTNGLKSTTFFMPKLAWPKQGPVMAGEGRTPLPLNMMAYRTLTGDAGADDELVITNDSAG